MNVLFKQNLYQSFSMLKARKGIYIKETYSQDHKSIKLTAYHKPTKLTAYRSLQIPIALKKSNNKQLAYGS